MNRLICRLLVCLLVCLLVVAGCDSKAEKGRVGPTDEPRAAAPTAAPSPSSSGALGGDRDGGLGALREVGARLDRAVEAYRGGGDPAAALAPIAWEPASDAVRLELEHAGATQVTHLGLELELLFFEKGRGRYYVRALVHAGPEGTSFLRLEGRPQRDGRLGVRGQPFEAWIGAGAPFAAAGRDLLDRLRGPRCAELPFVELARLRALIPEDDARAMLERDLADARGHAADTCAGMADVAGADVQLRVDDHIFLARAGDGRAVGFVRGAFIHASDGTVTLSLGRFRPVAGRSSRPH